MFQQPTTKPKKKKKLELKYYFLAEEALTIDFDNTPSAALSKHIHALVQYFNQQNISYGIRLKSFFIVHKILFIICLVVICLIIIFGYFNYVY